MPRLKAPNSGFNGRPPFPTPGASSETIATCGRSLGICLRLGAAGHQRPNPGLGDAGGIARALHANSLTEVRSLGVVPFLWFLLRSAKPENKKWLLFVEGTLFLRL